MTKFRAHYFLSCAVFTVLLFPSTAFSAVVGFAENNIWFSQYPFFENDSVRIHTTVHNSSAEELNGAVVFYLDNKTQLGKKEFSVSPAQSSDVWIDWTATSGEFSFYAEININEQQSTKPTVIFVDTDTDGDRVGNREDKDDDADALSDAREVVLGTDPLNPDSDGDGILDGADTQPLVFNKKPSSEVVIAIEKAKNTANTFTEKTSEIKDSIPEPVINAVKNTAVAVENFRKKQAVFMANIKSDARKRLDEMNASLDTPEQVTENTEDTKPVKSIAESTRAPFNYVSLAAVSVLGYALSTKFVFYAIFIVILFLIFRYVYKKIFKKEYY